MNCLIIFYRPPERYFGLKYFNFNHTLSHTLNVLICLIYESKIQKKYSNYALKVLKNVLLSHSDWVSKFSKAFPFKKTGELRIKSTGWAVANCGFIPNSTKGSNIAKAKLFVKMSTKKKRKKNAKKIKIPKRKSSLKSWIF